MKSYACLALLVVLIGSSTPLFAADLPPIDLVGKEAFCNSPRSWLAGRAPSARDYDWDIQHCTLFLWPDFDNSSLAGSVSWLSFAEVALLDEVLLDFRDPMNVLAVTVDGIPALYDHANDKITVTLNPAVALGDSFRLSVEFAGEPQSTGFGSFNWDSHNGTPMVWTLSEPEGARDWWPCKDVPDEKFLADIYYRVPDEFSAPGPGLLLETLDNFDGTHTWHWQENYPINSYLIAMTVTDYVHYTDWYDDGQGSPLPIENYVFAENFDNAVEDLSITPTVMGLLDSVFGGYPFRTEKYGHALFNWGGAMEHQTCTSYGSFLLTGDHRYDRIVVHELAHQWYGNAVTLQDWENVWLNEGFASYSEAIWFEYTGGQEGLTNWMTITTADGHFDGPVYNNPSLFGSTVYRKGAWVLHMLRWLLDDDAAFYAALRYYYDQHEFGNAHTVDLQADLEAATGLDLEVFFQQWVYGVNRPVYEWAWNKAGGPGAWELQIVVRQVQDWAGLFVMPLPLRVDIGGDVVDLRLDNNYWSQLYSIPMGDDEPLGVVFDPDNWVLDNHFEGVFDISDADGEAPALDTALRGNWPNPFNPRTQIDYSLQAAGPVRLAIVDVAGRVVRRLVDGPREAGPHSVVWDGLDEGGRALPSGVYLAILEADGGRDSHRLTLLK